MFLLNKIVSKFTPKHNKLHLTTLTLFKANFNKIYTPNCTTYSFPRLPSRVGVKYSLPSTQVHQVPQIYTKYKYTGQVLIFLKST